MRLPKPFEAMDSPKRLGKVLVLKNHITSGSKFSSDSRRGSEVFGTAKAPPTIPKFRKRATLPKLNIAPLSSGHGK
jgi:hypothetical protein